MSEESNWTSGLPLEHKKLLGSIAYLLRKTFAEDDEVADEWLNAPCDYLDGQPAEQLMRTLDGAEEVKEFLSLVVAMQQMGKLPTPAPIHRLLIR